ncbi:MAG: helix-turn-helix domain-containing protein [Faecalibacterium sp.]|jgi:DNA-binding XRE family transcriptional regulator/desulfoferrodoxin (superoxide reductase-like protein)|nr:helix-turn-helix domain-containing protein [Faecalibacterium sp.]
MAEYVTGGTIRALREKRTLTQKQLAEELMVSDKTISKWETGHGLPDISLLAPLAKALHVSVAELLHGEWHENSNRSGNLLRGHFYVCPVCGNVLYAQGEGSYSCCGIQLPPLEAEEPDAEHFLHAEKVDNEWYVTVDHPMEKEHYLSFLALVTGDRVQLVKLYPEQAAEARFSMRGAGILYACCNRHGLFRIRL